MARILLLDEDSPLRTLTVASLRVGGHQTVATSTAEQALALATRERFDLILVDLNPPDMNPIQMIEQLSLSTGHGDTPIVTMADVERENLLVATAEAGAVDHLRKPFGFGVLEATVKRLVTAAPEKVDDLRVARKSSAGLYKQTLDLIETAKSS